MGWRRRRPAPHRPRGGPGQPRTGTERPKRGVHRHLDQRQPPLVHVRPVPHPTRTPPGTPARTTAAVPASTGSIWAQTDEAKPNSTSSPERRSQSTLPLVVVTVWSPGMADLERRGGRSCGAPTVSSTTVVVDDGSRSRWRLARRQLAVARPPVVTVRRWSPEGGLPRAAGRGSVGLEPGRDCVGPASPCLGRPARALRGQHRCTRLTLERCPAAGRSTSSAVSGPPWRTSGRPRRILPVTPGGTSGSVRSAICLASTGNLSGSPTRRRSSLA